MRHVKRIEKNTTTIRRAGGGLAFVLLLALFQLCLFLSQDARATIGNGEIAVTTYTQIGANVSQMTLHFVCDGTEVTCTDGAACDGDSVINGTVEVLFGEFGASGCDTNGEAMTTSVTKDGFVDASFSINGTGQYNDFGSGLENNATVNLNYAYWLQGITTEGPGGEVIDIAASVSVGDDTGTNSCDHQTGSWYCGVELANSDGTMVAYVTLDGYVQEAIPLTTGTNRSASTDAQATDTVEGLKYAYRMNDFYTEANVDLITQLATATVSTGDGQAVVCDYFSSTLYCAVPVADTVLGIQLTKDGYVQATDTMSFTTDRTAQTDAQQTSTTGSVKYPYKITSITTESVIDSITASVASLSVGDFTGKDACTYYSGAWYCPVTIGHSAQSPVDAVLTLDGFVEATYSMGAGNSRFNYTDAQEVDTVSNVLYSYKISGISTEETYYDLVSASTTLHVGDSTGKDTCTYSASAFYCEVVLANSDGTLVGEVIREGYVTADYSLNSGTTRLNQSDPQSIDSMMGVEYTYKINAVTAEITGTDLMSGVNSVAVGDDTGKTTCDYYGGTTTYYCAVPLSDSDTSPIQAIVDVNGYTWDPVDIDALTSTRTSGSDASVTSWVPAVKHGFKISANDELGNTIAMTATNTTVVLSGLTSVDSGFDNGVYYLAATGSGTLTVQPTGYIYATSTTRTYSTATQTLVSFDDADESSIQFGFKVTAQDELGNTIGLFDSADTSIQSNNTGFNVYDTKYSSGTMYVVADGGDYVDLAAQGYVTVTSTNMATYDQNTQQILTFDGGSGGPKMSFNLRIAAFNELGSAIMLSSSYADVGGISGWNDIRYYNGYAYVAWKGTGSPSIGYTGYITETTFSTLTADGTSQVAAVFDGSTTGPQLGYALKIISAKEELGNTLTIDGVGAEALSVYSDSACTTPASAINITQSGTSWYAAVSTGTYFLKFTEPGYASKCSDASVSLDSSTQKARAYESGDFGSLQYNVKLGAVEDELGNSITIDAAGSEDFAIYTDSACSVEAAYKPNGLGSNDALYSIGGWYAAVDDSVIYYARFTEDGMISTCRSTSLYPDGATQSTVDFTSASGDGLLFPVKIIVSDEFGNSIDVATLGNDDFAMAGATEGTGSPAIDTLYVLTATPAALTGGLPGWLDIDSSINTQLATVNPGFSTQTVITLSGTIPCASGASVVAGTSVTCGGLKYNVTIAQNGPQNELGSALNLDASPHESIHVYTDAGCTAGEDTMVIGKAGTTGYDAGSDAYYFAVPEDINYYVKLSEDGHISKCNSFSISVDSGAPSLQSPDFSGADALDYAIKVTTVTEELGNALTIDGVGAEDLLVYMDSACTSVATTIDVRYATGAWYLATVPGSYYLKFEEPGYVASCASTMTTINNPQSSQLNPSITGADGLAYNLMLDNVDGEFGSAISVDGVGAEDFIVYTDSGCTVEASYLPNGSNATDALYSTNAWYAAVATGTYYVKYFEPGFMSHCSSTLYPDGVSQTTFDYTGGNELVYGFAILATDELGAMIYLTSATSTITLGGGLTQNGPTFYDSGQAYVAATGSDAFAIHVDGYVDRTSDMATYSATSPQSVSFTGASALDFGYVVSAQDELGNTLSLDYSDSAIINAAGVTIISASYNGANAYVAATTTSGQAVSLSKAGYVDKTSTSMPAYDSGAQQQIRFDGVNEGPALDFAFIVNAADELSNALTLTTADATLSETDGSISIISVEDDGVSLYVAATGSGNISISKDGFIESVTTTTPTYNSSAQTTVDFNGTDGVKLGYAFMISAADELGNALTLTQSDSSLTLGGTLTSVSTRYDSGMAYLAATGTGVIEISHDGYVNVTSASKTYNSTSQTTIDYDSVDESALPFAFVVSAQDELETGVTLLDLNADSSVTSIAGLTVIDTRYDSGDNKVYVAATGTGTLIVHKDGYVDQESVSKSYNNGTQIPVEFDGTDGSKLPFAWKVSAKSESSTSLALTSASSSITVQTGLSAIDSQFDGGYAYVAATGSGMISISHDGYVDETCYNTQSYNLAAQTNLNFDGVGGAPLTMNTQVTVQDESSAAVTGLDAATNFYVTGATNSSCGSASGRFCPADSIEATSGVYRMAVPQSIGIGSIISVNTMNVDNDADAYVDLIDTNYTDNCTLIVGAASTCSSTTFILYKIADYVTVATADGTLEAGASETVTITYYDNDGVALTTGDDATADIDITLTGGSATPASAKYIEGTDCATEVPSAGPGVTSLTCTPSGSTPGVVTVEVAETIIGDGTDITVTITKNSGSFPNDSGQSSPFTATIDVLPGSIDHFDFSCDVTETNGDAFANSCTLTAIDAGGNTITSFDASSDVVTITNSLGGTITGLGSYGTNELDQAGDFTSGVASLDGLLTYEGPSGSGTFTATTVSGASGQASVTINPGALDSYGVTCGGVDQTNAATFTSDCTITVLDVSSNVILNFDTSSITTTISTSGALASGDVSGGGGAGGDEIYSTSFASGVANLAPNGLIYTGASGVGTLVATSDSASGNKTGLASLSVIAGALDSYGVTCGGVSQTNAATFTSDCTVTALDVSSNVITDFSSGTVYVTTTISTGGALASSGDVSGGGGAGGDEISSSSFTSGVANLNADGLIYTGISGSGTLVATSDAASGGKTGQVSLTVNPGAHYGYTVTCGGVDQTSGYEFTADCTVTAIDESSNIITDFDGSGVTTILSTAGALTGDISGGGGTGGDEITALSFASGTANLNTIGMIYSGISGTGSLMAADVATGMMTGQTSITVVAGDVDHFILSHDGTAVAGVAETLTLTAVDTYGNTNVDYEGRVIMTSDAATSGVSWANVSGDGSFVDGTPETYEAQYDFAYYDSGMLTFTITTTTAESVSIDVCEPEGACDDDSEGTLVVSHAPLDYFMISHDGTATAGVAESVGVAAYDEFDNGITDYTGTITLGGNGTASGINWAKDAAKGTLTNASPAQGQAQYTFVIADLGSVTFGFTDDAAESVNLSVTDGTTTDDDSEGNLVVEPGVDVTPPGDLSYVYDGLSSDVTYTTATTELSANWAASSDPDTGVARYWYSIGTSAGASDTVSWTDNATDTYVTLPGLTLLDGTTYFFNVKAENGDALESSVTSSNGAMVDATAPSSPNVYDGTDETDDAYSDSTSQLDATWSGSTDAGSGVAYYYYSAGSSAGATDVIDWTGAGASTTATISGLTLTDGATYYVNVKATDNAGLTSGVASSNGVTVDASAPSVSITSPGASALVEGVVSVTGSILDVALDSWTLSYGVGATPDAWNQIATGSATISAGAIASWDTSSLSAGSFTLKLTAVDALSRTGETTVTVEIADSATTISGTITSFQWTLVSAPAAPTPSDVVSMFGSTAEYKVYKWDPETADDQYLSKYVVPASVSAGDGFWIQVYYSDLSYAYAAEITAMAQDFEMPLKTGWNQIGSPFNQSYAWGSVMVKYGTDTYTLATAVSMGLISEVIDEYDNSANSWVQRDATSVLTPQKGYFARAYSDVTLVFDPNAGASNARIIRKPFDYKLRVSASTGGCADLDNFIGAARSASDEFDAADSEEPPRSPGGKYISLYFPRDDWALNAGRYSSDVRASDRTGETETWPFNVDTSESGDTVTLTWDSSILPSSLFSFTLINLDTGERVDMTKQDSYSYTAPGGDVSQTHFKIEVLKLKSSLITMTHDLTPGWNLISVPLDPEITDALEQLGDDLERMNVFQYFDNDFYSPENVDIQAGIGYWINVSENTQIDIIGVAIPDSESIEIPLKKGWNLLGNPYESELAWGDNVSITCGDAQYALSEAIAAGTTDGVLYEYDGEAYSLLEGALQPWKGYFLKSVADCTLILGH